MVHLQMVLLKSADGQDEGQSLRRPISLLLPTLPKGQDGPRVEGRFAVVLVDVGRGGELLPVYGLR